MPLTNCFISLHLFICFILSCHFKTLHYLLQSLWATLAFFYRTLGTSTLYSEHTWALPVDALPYASDHLWTLMRHLSFADDTVL